MRGIQAAFLLHQIFPSTLSEGPLTTPSYPCAPPPHCPSLCSTHPTQHCPPFPPPPRHGQDRTFFFTVPGPIGKHRPELELCVSSMTQTFFFTIPGPIGRLLSFKIWEVLSRLTYTVYLIHVIIISLYLYNSDMQFQLNNWTIVSTWCVLLNKECLSHWENQGLDFWRLSPLYQHLFTKNKAAQKSQKVNFSFSCLFNFWGVIVCVDSKTLWKGDCLNWQFCVEETHVKIFLEKRCWAI